MLTSGNASTWSMVYKRCGQRAWKSELGNWDATVSHQDVGCLQKSWSCMVSCVANQTVQSYYVQSHWIIIICYLDVIDIHNVSYHRSASNVCSHSFSWFCFVVLAAGHEESCAQLTRAGHGAVWSGRGNWIWLEQDEIRHADYPCHALIWCTIRVN